MVARQVSGELQSKGIDMRRILFAAVMGLGVLLLTADQNTAHAQYGYGYGHHHAPVPSCSVNRGYQSAYRAGYGAYVSPYSYRYGSPGLTVTRSSYYAPSAFGHPAVIAAPSRYYGLGGYGNLGYPSLYRPSPGIQLRIGF